jgi:levanase/fructan beta-fructosidase
MESVKVSPKNNKLFLDILVDKSIVEVYVNSGEKVITELVFPEKLKTSEVFNFH